MSENEDRANITAVMPWRTLREGMDGPDVVAMQKILRALSELAVVDGDFGPRTGAAVEAFQRKHGLAPDRVVGPMTRAAILDAAPAEDPDGVEFNTAGEGDPDALPVTFDASGWCSRARRAEMHKDRIGGVIRPMVTYVHSTDCRPGTFETLIRRWAAEKGNGAGANFLLGKTPATGLAQLASIFRNSNHAGGMKEIRPDVWIPFHGDFVINGKIVHPNLIANGVEVDNAGRLDKKNGRWIHTASGYVFDDADVYVDARGKGYERYTPYQFEVLGWLLPALAKAQAPLPAGTAIKPNGDYPSNGAQWAKVDRYRVVGHATINPLNKTDPGPQMMDWVRANF